MKNSKKKKEKEKGEKKTRRGNPWGGGYQANDTVVVYSDSAFSLVVSRSVRSSVCGGGVFL